MSLCNVHCDADRVLLGVDTAGATFVQGEDSCALQTQKAMVVGTTVVAGRGALGILYHLQVDLLTAGRFWNIDTLRPELESALNRARARTLSDWAASGKKAGEQIQECEITIAGWSDRLKQMRAYVATLQANGDWVVEMISARCIAPAAPNVVDDDVSSEQAQMAVARKQVEHCKAEDPEAAIGGQLIVYDIRSNGIIIRQSGVI